MRCSLIPAALILCSLTATAQELPVAPFTAHYTVYGKGLPLGEATLTLTDEGNGRYRMSSDVRPTGVAALLVSKELSERVNGRFEKGIPQPARYEQQQRGDDKESTVLEFDWQQGELQARSGGEQATLPLTERVVDPLSLHLLVMEDLQQGRQEPAYTLVDDTEIKTYNVSHDGQKTLDTPLGPIKTVQVSRQRPGSSRVTRLWFAPAYGYLPVQITQYKDGSEDLSMVVKQISGR